MIKTIYRNRIETLKKDYNKLYKSVEHKQSIIKEYLLLNDEVLKKIETITENTNIEPNLKYIEIDKEMKYIETILLKISDIQTEIANDYGKLNKEKGIIINSCLEEYDDITREKVLMEIDELFKK